MIKKVVYFNTWHNGDVFVMKGYMHSIQQQLPEIQFAFAHRYSPKLIQDLGFQHLPIHQVPAHAAESRFTEIDDVLFVNTWVGLYTDQFEPGQRHCNYTTLHRIWTVMNQELSARLNKTLKPLTELWDYIPSTDWNKFEIAAADDFINKHADYVLICNGLVRSEQSNLALMQDIIVSLADHYPDTQFVCTAKFVTDATNISFTDDIFNLQTQGDINEIAYLSTRAKVIIGKNSGPYMFTHTRDTIFNPDKIFIALSQRPTDSYPYGCEDIKCKYFHHSQENSESIFNIIVAIMEGDIQALPGKMTVVEYQE